MNLASLSLSNPLGRFWFAPKLKEIGDLKSLVRPFKLTVASNQTPDLTNGWSMIAIA